MTSTTPPGETAGLSTERSPFEAMVTLRDTVRNSLFSLRAVTGRASGPTAEAVDEGQCRWADDSRLLAAVALLPTDEIEILFGSVQALRTIAEGIGMALLIEAESRGVITGSVWSRPADWVRAQAAAAGAPMTPSLATRYEEVARYAVRTDADMSAYRAAVTSGALSVSGGAAIRRDLDLIAARVPGPVAATAIAAMIDAACGGASPGELRAAREAVIASYGDEGEFEERQRHAYDHREMTAWRRDDHDRNVCTLRLDNASRAIVDAALAALAAPRPSACDEDGCVLERDPRTAAQRRADAVVELCRVVPGDPSLADEVRPQNSTRVEVIVTMRLSRLVAGLGYGTDACGQPLPASAVRRLCCDALIIPAILGADSELLDLGREARLASRGQRRALAHRDRCCTFPGCTRPSSWCEAHHLVSWLDGGPTDLDNLALLCVHHHTVVHHQGYVGAVGTDQVVRWSRSTPREAPTGPNMTAETYAAERPGSMRASTSRERPPAPPGSERPPRRRPTGRPPGATAEAHASRPSTTERLKM